MFDLLPFCETFGRVAPGIQYNLMFYIKLTLKAIRFDIDLFLGRERSVYYTINCIFIDKLKITIKASNVMCKIDKMFFLY